MNKETKLLIIVGIIVSICIIIVYTLHVYTNSYPDSRMFHSPQIDFEKDEVNKTLTCYSVSEDGLSWSDMESWGSGTCNLPTGTISKGDEITECSGTFKLVWIPKDKLLGEWTFGE